MADLKFREKYRTFAQPSLTFEHGPWLRKEVAATKTRLEVQLVSRREEGKDQSHLEVRVRNTGALPSFYTEVDIEGTKRTFYATDNGFWLAPKQERLIDLQVMWRGTAAREPSCANGGRLERGKTEVPVGGGAASKRQKLICARFTFSLMFFKEPSLC